MTDLRDLLDQAAGEPPAALPLADIRRRGHSLTRRRHVITGAGLVAAAAVVAAAVVIGPQRTAPPPSQHPPVHTVTPTVLKPGTYTDPSLTPHLTFTVPDGLPWRATLVTPSSLILTNDSVQASVSLQHWSDVYQPVSSAAGTLTTAPRPANLIQWLARHPALNVASSPEPAFLGNRPAQRITVSVKWDRRLPTGPAVGCSAAADCLILADTPDNPVVIPQDDTAVVVADDDSSGLVLTAVVPTDNIDAFMPTVDKIINSLILE